MKRFAVLLSLCAIAVFPLLAHAGWVTNEIRWRKTNQGGYNGTSIWSRDTAYAVIDGETLSDTTGTFSLDDADVPPRGTHAFGISAASAGQWANDTTGVGYLCFQPDSTAAGTSTITVLGVLIEGRASGMGRPGNAAGWVKVDSVSFAHSGINATGKETIICPLRTFGAYQPITGYGELRGRIVACTGILSGQVRAFVRFWQNNTRAQR